LNRFLVAFKIAMGEVESSNIHSCSDHLIHDLLRFGRRSDGTDDFGFIHWQSHLYPSGSLSFMRITAFLSAALLQ
jgi:hypothetical protein